MENQELVMFDTTVKKVDEFIFIKPFCDFFGINYENQCRVITGDEILQKLSTKKSDKFLFGDNFKRVAVNKVGYLRWIQLINPSIVQPNLKDNLIKYQVLIFDFLYGEIETKELVSIKYSRLKKLKRLYGKIGVEIQTVQNDINNYVEGHLGNQLALFEKRE